MSTMLTTNTTLPVTPSSHYPAVLETTWASIVQRYPASHIDMVLPILVQLFTFWITGFVLTYLLPSPPFTKFQPAQRQPSNRKIFRAALYSLRNQLFIHGLHAVQFFLPGPAGVTTQFRVEAPLPPIQEMVWQMAIAVFVREVLFYYGHRVLHSPKGGIYQKVHKMHHEFVTPTAWSAQYCTVLEHVIANVLPILIPGVLLRMHIITFTLWSASQSFQATVDHAGWNTWLWWQAQSHDRHHELFKVNFGTIGILDWIHGTQDSMRKDGKEVEKMHYE